MTVHSHSPNYDYLIGKAAEFAPHGGRILDYGCGTGTLMALALDKTPGLDFWGADTFEGLYTDWKNQIPDALQSRILPMEGGKVPFDDGTFDVVLSNQVFEHVADAETALTEIHRVLVPGGYFLSVFPLADTWFEPHSGIYFAHWLKSPKRQDAYLAFWRARGFGYYPGKLAPADWGRQMGHTIRTACHYRTRREIVRLWHEEFGTEPQSLVVDAMQYRIDNHPRFKKFAGLSPVLQPLLGCVYHIRAGTVLLSRKR